MSDKESIFVSAVVYVHNAEKRIADFLTTISEVLRDNFENAELICVNDASDDDSLEIIRKSGSKIESISITVINMSSFYGVEMAMKAGVDMAIGDFVFEFDTTIMDYDKNIIMEVYRHAITGYDVVSASPNKRARASSKLFYNVFDSFSDTKYKMVTESFRILSRRVINRTESMNNKVLYRKAVYANSGLKTDSIVYECINHIKEVDDRKERRFKKGLAVDALLLFTKIGYRFSMAMTFVMMVVSILMAVYSLVTFIIFHPVEGWTTTILFFSFAFFGMFGIMTIIVKYLQLLLDMAFKRKYYGFDSIEKITK